MATPTVTKGVRHSFIDTAGLEVNITDSLDAMYPKDTPMLSLLGWASEAGKDAGAAAGADTLKFICHQNTHTWVTDDIIPNKFVLNAAYAVGAGQLDVGTTVIDYISVNDVLYTQGGTHFRVTATNGTTGIATVELVSGSTDAAVANGGLVHRISNAQVEGATGTIGGQTPDPTQTSNYVQHIQDEVSISDVEELVKRYAIDDNVKRHIAHLVLNNILQLEKQVIYNIALAPTDITSKPMFGGLWHFIRNKTMEETDQKIDAIGAGLTEDLFERCTRAIYNAGGAADCVMVPPIHASTIDDWNKPYVRLDSFGEEKYGGIVTQYRNRFFDGMVITNRHLDPGDVLFLTKDQLGFGPMSNASGGDKLSFKLKLLADRGRTKDWFFYGSYTMEVHNNTKAFGWIYNLARS